MSKLKTMHISRNTARYELFHLNLNCLQNTLIAFNSKIVIIPCSGDFGVFINATDDYYFLLLNIESLIYTSILRKYVLTLFQNMTPKYLFSVMPDTFRL